MINKIQSLTQRELSVINQWKAVRFTFVHYVCYISQTFKVSLNLFHHFCSSSFQFRTFLADGNKVMKVIRKRKMSCKKQSTVPV